MKNFIDNVFKPYIFPILLLIFGAYIKVGDNLKSVGEFFSNSTNSFIKFFSYQFYLWEVIFYLVVIFILRRLYKSIFQSRSKKERQMLKAIKRVSTDFPVTISGTPDKYLFKFKAIVKNEEFHIEKLIPYCTNCTEYAIRMTEKYPAGNRCNCGKEIDYRIKQDVESRIITVLEENE